MLDRVPGFSCGTTGSSGGSLSGFQRGARARGEPEPTKVTGRQGSGRADRLRASTVNVQRHAAGRELSETVGPGYHSRKQWRTMMLAAQKRLVGRLGGKP